MLVLENHRDKFTTNFAENKKTLDQLVIVRSKGLKNEVAGYITKLLKREVDTKTTTDQEEQEDQEVEQVEAQEVVEAEEETAEDSTPQEILVENQSQESS
jgi:small subunit ribosomal protein S17e